LALPNPEGSHIEILVKIGAVVFERSRLPTQGNPAIPLNPDGLNARQNLQHPFANHSTGGPPGHFFKRRINRQEPIVNRLTQIVADEIVHGKSAAHFIEQDPEIRLAPCQLLTLLGKLVKHGVELQCDAAQLANRTHGIQPDTVLQITPLDRSRDSRTDLNRPHSVALYQPQHAHREKQGASKKCKVMLPGKCHLARHCGSRNTDRNNPAGSFNRGHCIEPMDAIGLRANLEKSLSLFECLRCLGKGTAVGTDPIFRIARARQHHPVVVKDSADGVLGQAVQCAFVQRTQARQVDPGGDDSLRTAIVVQYRQADR